MDRRLLAILFLLSGAAGLIYQIVWSRHLTLIFGSTTLAVSAVITSFMAGLGLGSYLFARLADRVSKALRLYAVLEVGIALFALLFPVFLALLKPLFLKLGASFPDSYILFPLARFLLCFLALLPPTLMMGGTLPAMTRYFVKERETLGKSAGALYGLNTIGAMIGCAAAGFYLIPEFGTERAIQFAVTLNLIAAVGAYVLSRRERPGGAAAAGADAERSEPAARAAALSPKLILWLFGIAGFTSLAYEVLWTRALLFFLGAFAAYAFTIILSTFLFGIAVGSAAYPLLFRKGRGLLLSFGIVEIAIGIFGAFSVIIFGGLFDLIVAIERAMPSESWWKYIFARAGGSFAVVLLPTFLMGLAFPLASALYARAGRGYGVTVGNVYAANTLGGILGSLLAGFFLLPLLGQAGSIALIALLNLALGGAVLMIVTRRSGGRARALAPAILLLLVGAGAVNLFFSAKHPMILHSVSFNRPERPMELLYVDEGASASIAVLHDIKLGHDELNINGESTAYTTYTDMQVHLMLSHLPLLFLDEPEKVLVIGFGLGSTSYASVVHPSVREVRCVELVPKEVETAPFFESVNHGVLHHEKFTLTIDDGRNYVFRTDEMFDMISFNAVHPSHSPALYTVEFYEDCRKRMTEGGAICAWVPNNDFTDYQFRSLVKTFTSVFPNSSLWYVNPNHLVLVGTRKKLSISWEDFRAKAAYGPVREDLERYTLDDPYVLLGSHLMDEVSLERYTLGAPINSDTRPTIEYSRELGTRPEILDAMLYHRSSILPYLEIAGDRDAVIDTLRRYETAAFHQIAGQGIEWRVARYQSDIDLNWLADVHYREALRLLPRHPNLYSICRITDKEKAASEAEFRMRPDDAQLFGNLLRLYSMRGEWESCAALFESYRGKETLGTVFARSVFHMRRGEWSDAARGFRSVAGAPVLHVRDTATRCLGVIEAEQTKASEGLGTTALLDLAENYWMLGEWLRGEEIFREAVAGDTTKPMPHYRFGRALERAYRLREAESHYAAALEWSLPGSKSDIAIRRAFDRCRVLIALERSPNTPSVITGAAGTPLPIDPQSAEFRLRFGIMLIEEGLYERASLELRMATLLDENNLDAHLFLSRTFARRGLLKVAEMELRRAIEIAPDRGELKEELRQLRALGA